MSPLTFVMMALPLVATSQTQCSADGGSETCAEDKANGDASALLQKVVSVQRIVSEEELSDDTIEWSLTGGKDRAGKEDKDGKGHGDDHEHPISGGSGRLDLDEDELGDDSFEESLGGGDRGGKGKGGKGLWGDRDHPISGGDEELELKHDRPISGPEVLELNDDSIEDFLEDSIEHRGGKGLWGDKDRDPPMSGDDGGERAFMEPTCAATCPDMSEATSCADFDREIAPGGCASTCSDDIKKKFEALFCSSEFNGGGGLN